MGFLLLELDFLRISAQVPLRHLLDGVSSNVGSVLLAASCKRVGASLEPASSACLVESCAPVVIHTVLSRLISFTSLFIWDV